MSMKQIKLTNDEIDIILDLIDDQMDEFAYGPEGTEEISRVEISILENLKAKLEQIA